MTQLSPIPAHVLKFVADNLDTIPELESLLLLSESGDRSWTAEELAARTYVSTQTARSVLAALHRRGFITPADDPSAFKFRPGSTVEQDLIRDLSIAYRKHLIPLTTYLHSKGSASVKEFARAFTMKKDK